MSEPPGFDRPASRRAILSTVLVGVLAALSVAFVPTVSAVVESEMSVERTYYFQTGRYYTPVAGLTHFAPEASQFAAYRFHEEDPVFFQNGFCLTARVGEEIDGHVFF